MTMKRFFEPWERRPAHDDRLACVFFGEFEDIVGEVLVIHKLANNAADRVRRDSCAREDRDCVLKHRPRRILGLPGPTLADDNHLPVELFLQLRGPPNPGIPAVEAVAEQAYEAGKPPNLVFPEMIFPRYLTSSVEIECSSRATRSFCFSTIYLFICWRVSSRRFDHCPWASILVLMPTYGPRRMVPIECFTVL